MLSVILFIIGAVLFVTGFIVMLYFKNIVLFEGLLCAVITFFVALKLLSFHPVFALLTAAGVLLLLIALTLNTRFGFWIVSVLMSLIWSCAALLISEILFGEDIIWYIFCGTLGFVVSLALHISVRKRHGASVQRSNRSATVRANDGDFTDEDVQMLLASGKITRRTLPQFEDDE
jgi:hypothetical protein